MLNRSTVLVPDALHAMEKNLKAILVLTGRKIASLQVAIDSNSGTASIVHARNLDGSVNVVVFFPALPHDYRLGKDELDRWTGYFLHEISHALYTDERAWKMACQEGLGPLVNGMEDVRIERLFIQSATADNAKARLVELLAWAAAKGDSNGYDPNEARSLPWTLAFLGRVRLNKYPLPSATDAEARLKPAMRSLVGFALARLAKAKRTSDVLAIAREIKARLASIAQAQADAKAKPAKAKAKAKPKPEGQDERQGKRQDEGEDEGGGEGQDERQDADEGEGQDEGEGEGQDEGERQDEGDAQGQSRERGEGKGGDGQDEGANEGAQDIDVCDARDMQDVDLAPLSEATQKESAKALETGEAGREALIASILRNAIDLAGKAMAPVGGSSNPHVLAALKGDAQKASRLRQQAARVLRKNDRDAWARRLSAGRVDRHALGRLAAGDFSNPFARHSRTPGYETELAIVLDGSDSMSLDGKLRVAATLALVVAQAAEQVGVACEIVQFFGNQLRAVKAPRERLSSPAIGARLTFVARASSGSTPLSSSLAVMAKRLCDRAPHKRKMIFAITDGACDNGARTVRAIANHCETIGVEVIGLSIDSQVHGAFRFESRVASSGDVSQVGLGVLVRALENRPGFAN